MTLKRKQTLSLSQELKWEIPMITCLQPRRLLGIVFVVSVALASQPLKAAEPLSLLLRWDHQFQFAGYYAALWKGYYSDAGLEVKRFEVRVSHKTP